MSTKSRALAVREPPLVTEAGRVYRLGRALLRGYLGGYHRLFVTGREHLPRAGGLLIVSNHQSFLDIPVVAVGTPRHVAFVARSTLARSRFLSFLMRHSGSILIRPNTPDRAALEAMIAHLTAGDCVAVFPEGTRTRDGRMGHFRGGALVAARRACVPLVPACIRGAFEAWPRDRILPLPRRIELSFAAPIPADAPDALERARAAIAGMLGDGRPGR
jgi:1-acyl-sn-glycerol-3-phosphate acyltransferase